MPKAAAKATKEKAAPKKVAVKKSSNAAPAIDKIAKDALSKLKTLKADAQLQADLEWCIGSYQHDKNPIGLLDNLDKALGVFKTELARKSKGITAKFIADIEKALGN